LIVFISVLPILIGGYRHWSANRAGADTRSQVPPANGTVGQAPPAEPH